MSDSNVVSWIIPAQFTAAAEQRFARLLKRAEKIGAADGLRLDIGKPFVQQRKSLVVVELHGTTPRLGDFAIVARIDHETNPAVVTGPPGGPSIDARWRTAEPVCSHCQLARERKVTYLVAENGSDPVQVGSSCMASFLGIKMGLSDLWGYFDELGPDWWEDEQVKTDSINLHEYLAFVVMHIRRAGWTPKTKASFERPATATSALDDCLEPRGEMPTPDDHAQAQMATKWAAAMDPGQSSFMNNVQAIAQAGWCSFRHVGLAAAIVPVWRREMEERRESNNSNYIGQVGERLRNQRVAILGTRITTGYYGDSTLVRMEDFKGNRINWWYSDHGVPVSGTSLYLDHEGRPDKPIPASVKDGQGRFLVIMDATVKSHAIFQGRKETTVTRARLRWPE